MVERAGDSLVLGVCVWWGRGGGLEVSRLAVCLAAFVFPGGGGV